MTAAAADEGFIGIYADPEGTQRCTTIPPLTVDTLYVVATTGFSTQAGIQNGAFRLQVTHPEGYHFVYEGPDAPHTTGGLPFDLTPADPWDWTGALISFRECQTQTHRAGDRIPFGRIIVANLSGGPTELLVQRIGWSFFNELSPELGDCRIPVIVELADMRRCDTDVTGEPIAFRFGINDPNCDEQRPCAEDCAGKPCVDFVLKTTPSIAWCPGDSLEMQIRFWNCGPEPEDVQLFLDHELVGEYSRVAPGDTILVRRNSRPTDCIKRQRRIVGAVARNATCPEPSGVEHALGNGCSACDSPPCPMVYLSLLEAPEIGSPFAMWISTERVEDLYGLSGRLRFTPGMSLQGIGVSCRDPNGFPLDLGDDVLCYGRANNEEGYVDFSVTRRGPVFGVDGALRVARVELTFPPGSTPDECVLVRLESLRAIDSFGRALCVEPPKSIGGVCSRSTCTLWPGDTNNDGGVDENDILTLAAFWGAEGPPRRSRGCFWTEVAGKCWPLRDAMFSDAYGDGSVGADDVLCVGSNWGRSHPVTGAPVVPPVSDPEKLRDALRDMHELLTAGLAVDPGLAAAAGAVAELLDADVAPRLASLEPNVPNPFNPRTRIRYDVATSVPVRIGVYDVAGRHVRDLVNVVHEPGRYGVEWDGTNAAGHPMPSGVYHCKAVIGGEVFTRKMVLAR